MSDENEELDSFLSKVDEIEKIIKGLANPEDEVFTKDAILKADEFLKVHDKSTKKKAVDRTVINDDAFKDESPATSGPRFGPTTSQESFMAAMEQDSKERAERRRQREKEATRLKEEGNKQFSDGNYDSAIQLYTQAIEQVRDSSILYTNRAQAYLRLAKYDNALEDCTWAFKVFENCLKACIIEGKAYLGLKQYSIAIDSFNKALRIDPKKEKLIREYISEVELARNSEAEEASARQMFEAGDMTCQGLVELLGRVNKPDQLPVFYAGGVRVIERVINDANERTLLRTHGGLRLTQTHHLISKCFAAAPRSISREEAEMCAAYLDLLRTACTDNERNQIDVQNIDELPGQLLRYMESTCRHGNTVAEAALKLLHLISQSEHGRARIVAKYDVPRLIAAVFGRLRSASPAAMTGIGLVNNLALDAKFKAHMRNNIEEKLLPSFENLLCDTASSTSVMSCCVSTMANLCGDTVVRQKIVNRTTMWQACHKLLVRNVSLLPEPRSAELVHSVFGLLINMSMNSSNNASNSAVELTSLCCDVLLGSVEGELLQRCLLLLSKMFTANSETVVPCCTHGIVTRLMDIIMQDGCDGSVLKPCIACLTACTQHCEEARQKIISTRKGLKSVVALLSNQDDSVVGNAALCLSHCAVLPAAAATLAKTNIIMDLLVHARDQHRPAVQHNCAILIAKLAKTDQRHAARLQELHGVEILHSVLAKVKDT